MQVRARKLKLEIGCQLCNSKGITLLKCLPKSVLNSLSPVVFKSEWGLPLKAESQMSVGKIL